MSLSDEEFDRMLYPPVYYDGVEAGKAESTEKIEDLELKVEGIGQENTELALALQRSSNAARLAAAELIRLRQVARGVQETITTLIRTLK